MKKSIFILLFLLIAGSNLFCYDLSRKPFDVGMTFGFLFPGQIYISVTNGPFTGITLPITNQSSFIFKLSGDYNILPFLSIGASVHYIPLKTDTQLYLGYFDNREHFIPRIMANLFEINAGIKGRILINNIIVIKPGFSAGIHMSIGNNPDFINNGGVLTASIETLYYHDKNLSVNLDIGCTGQFAGGIYGTGKVTSQPLFYLMTGFGF